MSEHNTPSGELECAGGVLSYRSGDGGWSILISAIRLIGEYTNSDGPFLDDYFLVFLTAVEDGWHQASFYAEGRDEALRSIETRIGATIEPGLCDSTTFRTRILWPPHLKGEELMKVAPRAKKTPWHNLSGSDEIILSQAARRAFPT